MNSEKCYFRYIKKDDTVDITFLLKIKDSMKQFNLSRKPAENIQNVLVRISANVQKAIKKAYKKKAPDNTSVMEIKWVNLQDEQLNCMDLFHMKEPVHLKIGDQILRVVFNTPWVINLSLPQSILVGFPVYPEHLVVQYAKKETSCFNWYRGSVQNKNGNVLSEVHNKWELVGENFSYIPSTHDIGKIIKIKCIPGNGEITGPIIEAISKNVVEAGPCKYPFETRHKFTVSKLTGKSFRCVTYNILADLYCDQDFTRNVLHPYCPEYALNIDYRKQLILKELKGYNADIICLQEVDNKIFHHYLQPFLKDSDLQGVLYKKGKEVAEGMAIFYRGDRFRFVKDERIVMSEALITEAYLQPIWDKVKENEKLKNRLLDRSTGASATFLESVDNPNEIILVGNTHLYCLADADHIRLIQGGIFIYWLNNLRKSLMPKFSGKRISLIICGDFNSVPSCGIYQLYTTGSSPSSLPDWKSNIEEGVNNLSLNQDTILESACGTPPYTNFTTGFADCLDYIFYERACLKVEQVVPLPSIEELQAHTALPSIVFPSDHIALVSDLQFLSY